MCGYKTGMQIKDKTRKYVKNLATRLKDYFFGIAMLIPI